MRILTLILKDKPLPEQRARKGKHGKWYNPQQKQMDLARREIEKQLPKGYILAGKDVAVKVDMTFFFRPSDSQLKSKQFKDNPMLELETLPHKKKPDIDNLEKFPFDRMNKLVFHDDSQIFSVTKNKFYSMNPRTEIQIIFYEEEEKENEGKFKQFKGSVKKGERKSKKRNIEGA